mgnify:CR=1 FL=1
MGFASVPAAIDSAFWTLADPPSDKYWGTPNGLLGDTHAWDGRWHKVRIHAKQGTTDGAFRIWWDDRLVLDQRGLNTQSIGNFAGISFGGNRNQGTDVPMSYFYGPCYLSRTDPGW